MKIGEIYEDVHSRSLLDCLKISMMKAEEEKKRKLNHPMFLTPDGKTISN